MITNDEIKNLKKSIEEQNLLIEQILNSNKMHLNTIESILKYKDSDLCENTSIYNKEVLEGDYISFYSNLTENIIVGRIISDRDNAYQLYYPLLHQVDYCCYGSIEELLDDYIDCDDFMIINTGKYSNMIPSKTSSYILCEYNEDKGIIYESKLSEEDDCIVLCKKDTEEILVNGNTYEETIFHAMQNYSLVIPLREN